MFHRYITYIDNYEFPDDDITAYPDSTVSINFEQFQVFPETFQLIIDNTDKTKYDPRYLGSMFYDGSGGGAISGVQSIIKVYDQIKKRYIFSGKIYNIQP